MAGTSAIITEAFHTSTYFVLSHIFKGFIGYCHSMILSYILVKTRYHSQITLGLLDFISINFWTSCVINEVYLYLMGVFIVLQLVEALRYKSEGHGFDSRWCHWNFSLT